MNNDMFWWNRARKKLARLAKEYNTDYTTVAYVFAVLLWNNSIKGARKSLRNYLSTGELPPWSFHANAILMWKETFVVTDPFEETFRALMGDESAIPITTMVLRAYNMGLMYKMSEGPHAEHYRFSVRFLARGNKTTPLRQQAMEWAKIWRRNNPGKRLPYV